MSNVSYCWDNSRNLSIRFLVCVSDEFFDAFFSLLIFCLWTALLWLLLPPPSPRLPLLLLLFKLLLPAPRPTALPRPKVVSPAVSGAPRLSISHVGFGHSLFFFHYKTNNFSFPFYRSQTCWHFQRGHLWCPWQEVGYHV